MSDVPVTVPGSSALSTAEPRVTNAPPARNTSTRLTDPSGSAMRRPCPVIVLPDARAIHTIRSGLPVTAVT
jgi:hypothetical protein